MTEALKNMMNVCLLQRKEISLQTSKRRRSQNLFYVVYICKSAKQEGRGREYSPPLILYMEKEKTKEEVLEGRVPIYDGIDFPVSFFRRNNQGII